MFDTRFGGGMMPHGPVGEADVVAERRTWMQRQSEATQARFCGVCTSHVGSAARSCRTCGNSMGREPSSE